MSLGQICPSTAATISSSSSSHPQKPFSECVFLKREGYGLTGGGILLFGHCIEALECAACRHAIVSI